MQDIQLSLLSLLGHSCINKCPNPLNAHCLSISSVFSFSLSFLYFFSFLIFYFSFSISHFPFFHFTFLPILSLSPSLYFSISLSLTSYLLLSHFFYLSSALSFSLGTLPQAQLLLSLYLPASCKTENRLSLVTRIVPAVNTSPFDALDGDADLSMLLDDTIRESLPSKLTFEADEVTGSLCDDEIYLQTKV